MNRTVQSVKVRQALDAHEPIVAMESTVIAHGLPFPTNLETAQRMEAIVRQHGATPATIAVLDGQLHVGLTEAELEHIATAKGIRKVSRRDLPIVVAARGDGATTVAATMTIAAWAGISVFATGGIGGVHRAPPYDVSNDLPTLASVPVAVVCSGAKSILNLPATLEWLETAGVPVIGYGTNEFPAFYCRASGLRVDTTVETPREAAAIIHAGQQLGLAHGTLISVPIPADFELPADRLEAATAAALIEAQTRNIEGSATTPFLLRWIGEQTNGASIRANVALLENNASVAAQIAVALAEIDQILSKGGSAE